MSIVETPDVTIEDLTSIGEGGTHIRCCVLEPPRFLCGAPYHPECEKEDDSITKSNCVECDKIRKCSHCRAGHQHCAFTGYICPAKEG